ncbi:MAG TPA: flavodoxin domain-containing protein [Methanospirillum sp.]|nr:flavodoxin domain-containing protein [Methanospirillum sp.]
MSARILVAYGTRNGSTSGIAEAISKELESMGYVTTVAEMKTVSSLTGYDAIVIGGPLYMGRLISDVSSFVKKFSNTLVSMPIAAFAVGMAPVSEDSSKIGAAHDALLHSLSPLSPKVSTIFAGSLDPSKLSFIARKMTEFVKSPTGDHRDWDTIATFARSLPGHLKV